MKITLAIAAAGIAGMGYLAAAGAPSPASYISNSFSQQQEQAQLQRQPDSTRTASRGNAANGSDPVVLELFTSQSCSSCPPADKLAAKLVNDPGVLVISRPVTYWDRLGWKDTLGREENTALQRAYARRGLGGRNGVYTPQIVADGRYGVVGSGEQSVRRITGQAARQPSPDITVTPTSGGGYTVALSGRTGSPAQLSLVALDSSETVGIGRGENRGRTVTYTNVVRDEEALGNWNGGVASFTIKPSQLRVKGADRYAVIIQQPNAGPILAGRYLK